MNAMYRRVYIQGQVIVHPCLHEVGWVVYKFAEDLYNLFTHCWVTSNRQQRLRTDIRPAGIGSCHSHTRTNRNCRGYDDFDHMPKIISTFAVRLTQITLNNSGKPQICRLGNLRVILHTTSFTNGKYVAMAAVAGSDSWEASIQT